MMILIIKIFFISEFDICQMSTNIMRHYIIIVFSR